MRETLTHETNKSQMNGKRSILIIAYIDALLFAIHLITYFIPAIRDAKVTSAPLASELLAIIAVAEHALLFPIVALLPAPNWAKHAGYGWLVIDIATDIMQLNNVAAATYLPMRYGGHIAAAIWIASASWQAKGAFRVIGLILAIDLAIYSFIAFIPFTFIILIPSLILLPLWIVLIGRRLSIEG
jgi:hypothetical protein